MEWKLFAGVLEELKNEQCPDCKGHNTCEILYGNAEKYQKLSTNKRMPEWRGLDKEDRNFQALETIVNSLNSNNIKVIIFTTPLSKKYLENVPEDDINYFISKLKILEKNYDLQFYNLLDSYSGLKIWLDPTHVTLNDEGLIYTKDIAKLIRNL